MAELRTRFVLLYLIFSQRLHRYGPRRQDEPAHAVFPGVLFLANRSGCIS